MALPFARSTRALHTDHQRPALIVLGFALLLLVLWTAWFLWAPISLYETGQIVGATRRGTLVAAFSPEAAARIQPGQSALLRPQGELAKQTKAIPAMVMEIRSKAVENQIQVVLYPLSDQQMNNSLVADPKGQAVVEVEQVSPAKLVWRASGQWVDTPAVVVNPQTQ